jgi:uncharacterized Ntn-hydrolase superfamily protein
MLKPITLALLIVSSFPSVALATWSVVAVDQRTGEVVIASATCVAQSRFAVGFSAKGLMDIQAVVVPGKGVAAAQASVDRTRTNQELIHNQIENGTDPTEIIRMLQEDPEIARRQFGIVDLRGRHAGYSGAGNGAVSLHSTGQVSGEPIFYAIQGNILAAETVVDQAVFALQAASGSLTDRVMAAMEAADTNGGDRRCDCNTEPRPEAPCNGKTAHVAYILQAHADDTSGDSFNNGDYKMYLSATDEDIRPSENANPVKTLRMRYDAWMANQGR